MVGYEPETDTARARYGASDGVKHRCNRNLSVERRACQLETGLG